VFVRGNKSDVGVNSRKTTPPSADGTPPRRGINKTPELSQIPLRGGVAATLCR